MKVRTRFAPSPTGVLHLGSVRTALFNWLYARHCGGQFVLRIEDTDKERSTSENVDAILDGLDWLGMEADEGPYFQTRRFDRYQEVLEQWLQSGKAYYCYCSHSTLESLRAEQMSQGKKTRYDGRCRNRDSAVAGVKPVVRFKNPLQGAVVVDDKVRGQVVFQNSELDDLIIARSDGSPTYNFSVVVDDCDMAISHVIRGDDHLNNTPKQMNMLDALGAKTPVYAHLPMILGSDGAKLSKRHGAVDIRAYREQGYLPEAMLNYLVRLGWSHGDQEIFDIGEMSALFDIADVNQSASSFNPQKLLWLNQQHIKSTSVEKLGELLELQLNKHGLQVENGPNPRDVAEAFRERAETMCQMAENSHFCYSDFEEFDAKAARKNLRPVILEPIMAVRESLALLNDWSKEAIAKTIEDVAAQFELSLGKLGQPVRVAVTGGPVSPPLDVTLWLIGQKRVVSRLDDAAKFIRTRMASD